MSAILSETSRVRIGSAVVLHSPPERKRVGANRRTRSRRTVFAAIIAAVGIPFFAFQAIESERVSVADPIFAEKFRILRQHPSFFQQSDPTSETILALGSSRTQLAFDANRFEETRSKERGQRVIAFNFGCAGCGPIATALYWRRLLTRGVYPEVLLLEIHPAMLAEQTPPFEHRWLHSYRLRREEVQRIRDYGWGIETPVHLRPGGWLNTVGEFRFALLNEGAPDLLPCPFGLTIAQRADARGFTPGPEVPPAQRAAFVERAMYEYAPAFPGYRPGGPAVAALRDVLQTCAERSIRVILVVLPESPTFQAWYPPDAAEAMARTVRDLARTGPATVIDARDWLNDDDFSDGHHATARGASRFSERLALEWPGVGP
jgi:hypothetical protein